MTWKRENERERKKETQIPCPYVPKLKFPIFQLFYCQYPLIIYLGHTWPASTMGHGNAMAAWPIMIKTIDHFVDCVCYKTAKKKYNMFWPVFWPVLLNWVLGKMKNEKHDEFYTTKNLPNHWLLFICLLYFCRYYIFSTLQTIGVFFSVDFSRKV